MTGQDISMSMRNTAIIVTPLHLWIWDLGSVVPKDTMPNLGPSRDSHLQTHLHPMVPTVA